MWRCGVCVEVWCVCVEVVCVCVEVVCGGMVLYVCMVCGGVGVV